MQTVKDIRRRATGELCRRIFRNGVFRRKHMKNLAGTLAREHTAGMSPEKLLALARHDTWLNPGRSGRLHSSYPGSGFPGEKTRRIAEKLESFLRSELRVLVDTFWEGRTSAELIVQGSSAELAGFFNGKRPSRHPPAESHNNDAHQRQAHHV